MTQTEIFGLARAWSMRHGPQVQTVSQNEAEKEFDWYIEQIKAAGVEVSPVKRSMKILKDEDGVDYSAQYFQRVKVEGSEEAIEQLKAKFKREG